MADRTSAAVFGGIFEYLAENPDSRALEFAKVVYGMTSAYDFNGYQMECDDALIKLGLAKMGIDEDGDEIVLFLHEDYD
jgi:hypothetical protein